MLGSVSEIGASNSILKWSSSKLCIAAFQIMLGSIGSCVVQMVSGKHPNIVEYFECFEDYRMDGIPLLLRLALPLLSLGVGACARCFR